MRQTITGLRLRTGCPWYVFGPGLLDLINRGLQSQTAFTPKTPIDVSARRQYTADLPTKLLFQCWSPRRELKAKPVVDHRKATRAQREAFAVDTDDMFALD